MENKPDNQSAFEGAQKPTENLCPECHETMVGSEHGTKLTCTNPECRFTMGFDPQGKPLGPNEDIIST